MHHFGPWWTYAPPIRAKLTLPFSLFHILPANDDDAPPPPPPTAGPPSPTELPDNPFLPSIAKNFSQPALRPLRHKPLIRCGKRAHAYRVHPLSRFLCSGSIAR
ncbi:hypothetical protein B9Z19DRAFT_1121592 [Tuber borchii]|uniref:Uncharacterized protein n=1 Tax=Tuber borchii TaxID=42251 RepID=A0A2T7A262_TUBBO|nr:hypothetical protein B9Z19DRAFT_1121592 [Tuber borchii]